MRRYVIILNLPFLKLPFHLFDFLFIFVDLYLLISDPGCSEAAEDAEEEEEAEAGDEDAEEEGEEEEEEEGEEEEEEEAEE
jgi:hypothetical protein